ncbi:hypothetical protein UO65_1542 [Actinokineospora spheciospongiae]|uniref:Uncharacterized protein n=1 Tax=Actinokineospora spheciospongiae TaxID=909613 RepID=W7J256_9PSEU|nr:hypothetical protein [Actinokineospora spheciospongiae]EWC63132.1 hypothetical protein UO65_1542 [Actinokineospora spheciospongiae]
MAGRRGSGEWGEEPLEVTRLRESGSIGDPRPFERDGGQVGMLAIRWVCGVALLGLVLAILATGNLWLLIVVAQVLFVATWTATGWRQFLSRDHHR